MSVHIYLLFFFVLFHLYVILCQTTRTGFLVERWQVMTGLLHYFHYLVERYTMRSIGKC